MRPKDIAFIVGILAVVGVLYYLSATGKKIPPIPQDEAHVSVLTEAGCLDCHGEGGPIPRKPEHPPKDECFKCHKQAEAGKGY